MMNTILVPVWVLAFFATIIKAELTIEEKVKAIAFSRACLADTGVNPDLIKAARQGNFSNDSKFKDYVFCMSKRIGFQNDAGELQNDAIVKKVGAALGDMEAAKKLAASCVVVKENKQDTAVASFKCYYDNTPNHLSIL
ncbi:hypothetical protein ABEB36_003272 [Hypothenemus hampei]|uniref:Uncharacterized protein n=1 Tax=Hypothenemus hampei TaxID=57062 RepID=A0ABD1FAF8_HYPHA